MANDTDSTDARWKEIGEVSSVVRGISPISSAGIIQIRLYGSAEYRLPSQPGYPSSPVHFEYVHTT